MNQIDRKWTLNWGMVFYVLFVACVAFFVWVLLHKQQIQDHKHTTKAQIATQIASCHRGNNLRRKINRQDRIIKSFMNVAIKSAELHAPLDTGAKRQLDLRNYVLFSKYAKAFNKLPLVHCTKVAQSEINNSQTVAILAALSDD